MIKLNEIIYVIVMISVELLFAQNADYHMERLVGKQDLAWLHKLEDKLPAHNVEFTKRQASGFKKTDVNTRKQIVLNKPWYFFKNQDKHIKNTPELVA